MNFDQIGKQHVSRRRRPSPLKTTRRLPSSFDAQFSQDVWPRPKSAGESADNRDNKVSRQHPARHTAGFSISLGWVKKLLVAAGVMVIGLIGTNWDSIADSFRSRDISPLTLEDAGAYHIMDAEFEPIGRWGALHPSTVESAVLSHEDIPLNLTETFTWTEYKVKQGDTVSGIASKFSLSTESIIAFNSIKEAWNLRTDKILKIPNMNGIPYTVQKNDSLSKIAAKMKVPQNAILDANNIATATIRTGEVLFIPGARMDASELRRATKRDSGSKAVKPMIFPVSGGKITSGYGWREDPVRPRPGEKTFHKAVDISGKAGEPVKAAMKGTVLHIDNNPNLGNFIILKHDGGYQTLYAHLSAYSVKTGEAVKQGQEIGKVGDTGYTTGPHLHLEVFRNGNRIDPLEYIEQSGI